MKLRENLNSRQPLEIFHSAHFVGFNKKRGQPKIDLVTIPGEDQLRASRKRQQQPLVCWFWRQVEAIGTKLWPTFEIEIRTLPTFLDTTTALFCQTLLLWRKERISKKLLPGYLVQSPAALLLLLLSASTSTVSSFLPLTLVGVCLLFLPLKCTETNERFHQRKNSFCWVNKYLDPNNVMQHSLVISCAAGQAQGWVVLPLF